ncbi:fused response regulator/phosphatase [Azospirillum picis]|uniref:Sigma-B regulation protein RsbU (Phosphoserine phosphatase) n=1 Tax=Azospirillum picis TaxID=488438 RepID=A0ABU0ML79_9PROT|nr:fused response regulator/phosphatase [Azospirillum picis]MBP2300159.1 sigma-B regulation protein RsbU (phosphoserine phosphatase) [Azospirillum picis]MDQ0533999.1 sigma-B regulation protein RsbU (phosphoserine phosphatase) [Azospirillum picis]
MSPPVSATDPPHDSSRAGLDSPAAATADDGILDCRVLVVDDIAINRTLIGALLDEAGFRFVTFAEDGPQAMEMIAAGTPDLLILDIMMPGMDGFEVCRRLRAMPETADLPILVQTALSAGEDRNRAFAAGATDLISKPLERTELLARVRIHLESGMLIRRLQFYRSRVEAELAIARSMQEHLLPTPAGCAAVAGSAGCSLRAHSAVSPLLGGDLWGLLPLDRRRFGVYLLNVPGRGVSAALNAFRLHTLLHELGPEKGGDPAALLTALNDRACLLLEQGERATITYGVVDGEAGRFVHASADSAPPMILCDGSPPALGSSTGLPIGAAVGTRYHAETMELPPGAVLALYSVAVLQALDAGGTGIGLGWLIACAVAEGGGFDHVVGALGLALGEASSDDHTLVWIRRDGGP